MNRERRPSWGVYGRWGLVVLLTLAAVQNTSSLMGGGYLTPAAAAAVLCGAALQVQRLPWVRRTPWADRYSWVPAPALATASAAVWGWPLLSLLLVALFDLAADRRARIAVGCALTAQVVNSFTEPVVSLWTPQQYGSSLFLLLAVVGGLWMGGRRRLVAVLGAQVEHLRIERELREQAARAAERSRIAAEMHDVLAHRLSLIALHTGVLTTKADALPRPVAERLSLLRGASTEALADLRDVLGALRATDAHAGADAGTGTGSESGAGPRSVFGAGSRSVSGAGSRFRSLSGFGTAAGDGFGTGSGAGAGVGAGFSESDAAPGSGSGRAAASPAPAPAPSVPPAPVLREPHELVEEARAAGQDIGLHETGRPEQAPAAHRLAVCRIVQEALTNTRKHAQGSRVTVRLGYAPPTTTVEIVNTAGAPSPGLVPSGFGLVGLRERVAALGGRLHAGPDEAGADESSGTWRLAARIPHPPASGQNGSRT